MFVVDGSVVGGDVDVAGDDDEIVQDFGMSGSVDGIGMLLVTMVNDVKKNVIAFTCRACTWFQWVS